MTDPVGGAPREYVPNHGPAVPAARDPEAEARPVIAQLDHSDLGPLTLQLQLIHSISNSNKPFSFGINIAFHKNFGNFEKCLTFSVI